VITKLTAIDASEQRLSGRIELPIGNCVGIKFHLYLKLIRFMI